MITNKYFLFSETDSIVQWDAFVEKHPQGTPSHLSGWLKTTSEAYGFKPHLVGFSDAAGTLKALFPFFTCRSLRLTKRLLSLPFSDYGGPLAAVDYEDSHINDVIRDYVNKKYRIEIRGSALDNKDLIANNYYKRHICNLDRDISEIQKGIDKKTIQRSIRKAQEAGVIIKKVNDQNGLEEFIRLNRLTRKKHGVPPQPKRWFDLLQKNVIGPGKGFIIMAELNKKVIGASVFLISGKTIHYKYNASDPDVLRNVSPNHLITWNAITWGVENNFTSLDFGRTSPDNKGLIRYKEMWGTQKFDLPYFYYPVVQGVSSMKEKSYIYQLYTKLWKSLPDFISDSLSGLIYRYLT